MGTINKLLSTSFLIILFSTSGFAQRATMDVTISVERNKDGEPTFYADNKGYTPYVVSVEFYNIRNSLPPSPNPVLKTVKPGRARIVRLEKTGLSDGGIGYGYRYSINRGCLDTEPSNDIEYLLPVAEGRQTEVRNLYYIGELVDKESPEDFYSLTFSAENGDNVYATRKGTVVKVVDIHDDSNLDKYFTSDYNYVQVVHDDCTFASYRHLKKGTITVTEGDEVYAGEPIAKVVPREGTDKPQFRLMINYRNPDYEKGNDEVEYWSYVTPLFRTGSEKFVELQNDKPYLAIHPNDVITQEMGWFERRRWKRRN